MQQYMYKCMFAVRLYSNIYIYIYTHTYTFVCMHAIDFVQIYC